MRGKSTQPKSVSMPMETAFSMMTKPTAVLNFVVSTLRFCFCDYKVLLAWANMLQRKTNYTYPAHQSQASNASEAKAKLSKPDISLVQKVCKNDKVCIFCWFLIINQDNSRPSRPTFSPRRKIFSHFFLDEKVSAEFLFGHFFSGWKFSGGIIFGQHLITHLWMQRTSRLNPTVRP